MSDETPEEEVNLLEPEEVQEIINWAIGTGALVTMLHNGAEHTDLEEMEFRLNAFVKAIGMMYDNLPACITGASFDLAQWSILKAEQEEDAVAELLKDIESW